MEPEKGGEGEHKMDLHMMVNTLLAPSSRLATQILMWCLYHYDVMGDKSEY